MTPDDHTEPDDLREEIEIGVLMANGRLAPRSFATREEAARWAADGEEVVEYNGLCRCDM
ncbi:hypothetical protein ACFT5B_01635 [Luteimicrobium sp. NPDC057192]|uniref:hypothetical protein n=1 Tax=Luteimicrobium sp. NPDC057192 TaxID=3346042 RepID=UPI00363EE3B1